MSNKKFESDENSFFIHDKKLALQGELEQIMSGLMQKLIGLTKVSPCTMYGTGRVLKNYKGLQWNLERKVKLIIL